MLNTLNSRALTIVIPALNEESSIATTVREILPLAQARLEDFEILLVNDGSSDTTGSIMEELAKLDPRIGVVHHKAPHGLGRTFREGLSRSKFPWLTLIPGDNAFHAAGIDRMFQAVGTAGMVMTYRDNQAIRSLSRSLQSHTLRSLINLLFGFRARDLHSMNIYPVGLLRRLELRDVGYGYQLEAVISLLRTGLSYKEVPVSLNPEIRGSSRALRPRNYLALGQVILRLLFRPVSEGRSASAVSAHLQGSPIRDP